MREGRSSASLPHTVRLIVIALAATIVSVMAVPVASADPTGGALGAQWTATHDGPTKYPNIHADWDVPITMSDGTVLKANIYRPAGANGPINEPMPTLVNLIPYTKLVSMIVSTGLSVPVFSEAVENYFRDLDLTGTAGQGITDITRTFGGGFFRSFSFDQELVKSGYVQVVVDVRGTGFSQGEFELFKDREQQDTAEGSAGPRRSRGPTARPA